jgi:hypothetical protein
MQRDSSRSYSSFHRLLGPGASFMPSMLVYSGQYEWDCCKTPCAGQTYPWSRGAFWVGINEPIGEEFRHASHMITSAKPPLS